jgi:protein-tyrosine phosphatase
MMKRGYLAAKNSPDRLLHARRHKDAIRQLSLGGQPKRILIVCYGNVCRSPYMEAILRRELPGVTVASAGFVGSGRSVPDASLKVSARRGVDLFAFRSHPLVAGEVESADLIVTMDAAQARELTARFPRSAARIVVAGDLDPRFESTRAIRDPWNQAESVFEMSFDRLDRCAATLVGVLRAAATRRAKAHQG